MKSMLLWLDGFFKPFIKSAQPSKNMLNYSVSFGCYGTGTLNGLMDKTNLAIV